MRLWRRKPEVYIIEHCRCVILREGHNPSRCPNPVAPGEDRCHGCLDRHPDMQFPDGKQFWVLTEPDYSKPRPRNVGLEILQDDDES